MNQQLSELRKEILSKDGVISSKDADILFLRRTNNGLTAENNELIGKLSQQQKSYEDLNKDHTLLKATYEKLKRSSAKEEAALQSKLEAVQIELNEIKGTSEDFSEPPCKKAYYKLQSTQRAAVNKLIRGKFGPKIDRFMKKRKISASYLVFNDNEGMRNDIRINFKTPHIFENLTRAERERQEMMSEAKAISPTANNLYSAFRRIIPDLPPLRHLKKHDDIVFASLPQLQAAPGRQGGFINMRNEAIALVEFLHDMGQLNLEEEVYLKPAADALKLTNTTALCIHSIQAISRGSEIGIVGAVSGGDSYEDLKECGGAFFKDLKDLATNPVLKTKVGEIPFLIRIGGDLVFLLELLGLSKATSNYPCAVCNLQKARFWETPYNPLLLQACNNHVGGRTRASIMNEAIKAPNDRHFSVKHMPLCQYPLNPNGLIIDAIVFCELHMRIRLCGDNFFFLSQNLLLFILLLHFL